MQSLDTVAGQVQLAFGRNRTGGNVKHAKYCLWYRKQDCPCEHWDEIRRAICVKEFGSDELVDLIDAERDGDQWQEQRLKK